MLYVDLDTYGLRVVDFSEIFRLAYKDIVKDLFTYEIFHDYNARRKDTKRVYYYHLTKHICDTIAKMQTSNRIVLYYSSKDINCDFKECTNQKTRHGVSRDKKPEFILFINRYFKQIKNILPIRVFMSDVRLNTFVQYYNTNKGKYIEIINMLRKTQTFNTNMERMKKFVEKYGLTYLTQHYVNNVKIKSMMYK